MELGLYTDSVSSSSLEEALDLAVEIGATAVELATGGQSSAPHLRIDELLGDPSARAALQAALAERGLWITALNCSAWPLHPIRGIEQRTLIEKTLRLAPLLGVRKVVTMSGTPGDGSGASFVNWVWYPWPAEALVLLERQWERVVALWRELALIAGDHGVERIAMELHPLHLVYNVPTLLRLRAEVGDVIGANVDPSHLFWQQMDPIAVVGALGPAVHHAHLKDAEVVADEVALAGVLDNRPFGDPRRRAWMFRTIGRAHGRGFWASFLAALTEAGSTDTVCIENEDVEQPQRVGVTEAAAFIRPLLGRHSAGSGNGRERP